MQTGLHTVGIAPEMPSHKLRLFNKATSSFVSPCPLNQLYTAVTAICSHRKFTMAAATSGPLSEKRVLVTGASRGIGRGIAVAFGEQGAKVYITGRRLKGDKDDLEETAALVRTAGGTCEAFKVDHADDTDVEELFRNLRQRFDNNGERIDVLVNNAYAAVRFLVDSNDVATWRKSLNNPEAADETARPGELWDHVNNVGLRNNFVCSAYAMRQFKSQGSGILVNVSSWGGQISLFDGAYGVGKCAIDRMSSEFAREAPKGVTCFTYYPGMVATENLTPMLMNNPDAWNKESPLFVGRALAKSIARPDLVSSMQGKIVIGAEVARFVGAKDEEGIAPLSFRGLRFALANAVPFLRHSFLLNLIPNFYVPHFILFKTMNPTKFW